MAELQVSLMSHGPTTADDLHPLLEEFGFKNRVRVRLRILEWDTAWAELLKVALYQHGSDVSEIGSTWMGSFVGMDGLQQFADHEIAEIGDPAAFIPTSWRSGSFRGHPSEQPTQWAIPLWEDARILYYRRDILDQVGIDEKTAFQTSEQLNQTLGRLLDAGVPIPWVIPTHQSRMTVHNVASLVWGVGGSFVSDDGRRTLFAQPQARAGIRAYFGLARYLTEPARNLDDTQSDELFTQGKAAVTISGPWIRQIAAPEIVANMGTALPPGTPFVAGSHLVCWKHTVYRQAAIKLIRFLTRQQVQTVLGQRGGLLPTRLDALASPPFADDPFYQVIMQGLSHGRSFHSIPLWGLVEEQLNIVFSELWADVLADPNQDLDQAIIHHLAPLSQRLDLPLGSRK